MALSNDSGDGDTLGPLPGGMWGSSDGEFPVAPYEYFHNRVTGTSTTSSGKSPSPGMCVCVNLSTRDSFLSSLSENRHSGHSHGSSGSSSASSHPTHPSSSSLPRPSSDNSNANNRSNGAVHPYQPRMHHSTSMSSSSEFTSVSQQRPLPQPNKMQSFSDREPDRMSIRSGRFSGTGSEGNLGVAANLAQSRESFQQALDNPCEYFIDVM